MDKVNCKTCVYYRYWILHLFNTGHKCMATELPSHFDPIEGETRMFASCREVNATGECKKWEGYPTINPERAKPQPLKVMRPLKEVVFFCWLSDLFYPLTEGFKNTWKQAFRNSEADLDA